MVKIRNAQKWSCIQYAIVWIHYMYITCHIKTIIILRSHTHAHALCTLTPIPVKP